MQNFTAIVLMTAIVSAKTLPDFATDADQEYWEKVEAENFYARNLWLGVFQGLYGSSGSHVVRPNDECFGDWIVEKRREVSDFRSHLVHNFWMTDVDEAR